MKRFSSDNKLNPTHISLYMALFQFWNLSHFSDVIFINREEVMKMSKIGSLGTYHRCLKQLHSWKYLVYLPSHNPFKSSQVKFLKFGTTTEITPGNGCEKSIGKSRERVVEKALVSNIKQIKQRENLDKPLDKQDVIDFFKEKNRTVLEAEKFHSHYEGVGWKLGGKIKIENWKAVAEKWVLKGDENKQRTGAGDGHLKTLNRKNYGEPL